MNEEDALMETESEDSEESEEETDLQELHQSGTQISLATQTQRKKRKTSSVWTDFVTVGVEDDGKERAKCVHCGTKLVITGKRRATGKKGGSYGTHHLRRHLERCASLPTKETRPPYDQKLDREKISEIIIFHDLPFRYVEFEKVRERDKYLCPDVQPICRQTAADDVLVKYHIEKEKLKVVLAKHNARVCFTADLWTDKSTKTGYVCLTAHFIDDGWKLNSKVLDFCEIKAPHTGEEIAMKILESLQEWGLKKKVFSLTLDNATNNNSMVNIVKGQLQMMIGSGLLLRGKYLHIRCSAHILNLIVKEGLEIANDVLNNIRESVRYVKGSTQRKETFAACVERVGIKGGSGLSLDVPTRWNSTYEMLARALKFRNAFVSMKCYDTNYKSLPSNDEWDRGERICDFLKPFSVITTHFSGSSYPTSSVYFTQVWRIELLLQKYAMCDDALLSKMAQEMKVKFVKYWKDYSLILAMGAVLDPRMKLEMLEKAYEAVDPTTSASKIKKLEDNMTDLYEDYQLKSGAISSTFSVTPTPQELVTESPLDDDYDNDLFELERSINGGKGSTKTNLRIYLDEKRLSRKAFPKLEILSYWKENEHRFGDLASMARDVLSIPITIVASESTFSIGSRVLTPYRNRLLPEKVQALICTRNWLRGYVDYEDHEDFSNEGSLKL